MVNIVDRASVDPLHEVEDLVLASLVEHLQLLMGSNPGQLVSGRAESAQLGFIPVFKEARGVLPL